MGASARGVRQQVRKLAAILSNGEDDVPDVPGMPRELVAKLMAEITKKTRSERNGVIRMKRVSRFLKDALRLTLAFFAWLFHAVFKWVM